MNKKILSCLTILLFTTACANIEERNQRRIDVVVSRAIFDLDCPKKQLKVIPLDAGPDYPAKLFGVSGCNRKVTYLYDLHSGTALMNSPREAEGEK